MKHVAEEQDLYKACRIIFGADLDFSREFLEYIQMTGVKSAFRKRAMESHPDRERCRVSGSRQLSDCHFHAVKDAYDTLCNYLVARDQGYALPKRNGIRQASTSGATRYHRSGKRHWQGNCPNQKKQTAASSGGMDCSRKAGIRNSGLSSSRYDGRGGQRRGCMNRAGLPKRGLLFGHYLYYMGVIDWHSLVKALVWQRGQRYRIGEMARKKGWLTHRDIQRILREPPSKQAFGQRARARGLLSDKQVAYLLCQQKKKTKKIGEYFLEKNILNRKQLAELLLSFHRHNAAYKQSPSF